MWLSAGAGVFFRGTPCRHANDNVHVYVTCVPVSPAPEGPADYKSLNTPFRRPLYYKQPKQRRTARTRWYALLGRVASTTTNKEVIAHVSGRASRRTEYACVVASRVTCLVCRRPWGVL